MSSSHLTQREQFSIFRDRFITFSPAPAPSTVAARRSVDLLRRRPPPIITSSTRSGHSALKRRNRPQLGFSCSSLGPCLFQSQINRDVGTSLEAQWLGLGAFRAGGPRFSPCQGKTKIPITRGREARKKRRADSCSVAPSPFCLGCSKCGQERLCLGVRGRRPSQEAWMLLCAPGSP